MVDIDQNELEKHTLSIDYPIQDDLKSFYQEFLKGVKGFKENLIDKLLKDVKNYLF